MGKRHTAIGIKQTIRFEWMQQTTNLLLAGLDAPTIRAELLASLARRKGDGSTGDRSNNTCEFVVGNLMQTWVAPYSGAIPFRDDALAFLRENPAMALAVHWGMIAAAYPFWFNVARQIGRLLVLQDQVTQAQIVNRLKEQYGDRQTVGRYAQYVVRSFVAWGVLKDCQAKGCYEKNAPVDIADPRLAILMFESALMATAEATIELGALLNHPAFFPFQLPVVTGDFVARHSDRIEVARYGMNDELLKLKGGQA